MEWQLLGYKNYPFSVEPISAETIELFTGHQDEAALCQSVLQDQNVPSSLRVLEVLVQPRLLII